MAEKVLMIGQFPPPVTGEGKVNLLVREILQQDGFDVNTLNSCIVDNVNDVGQLKLTKLLRLVVLLLRGIFFIPAVKTVYMTPGQTKFGLMRFLPFLLLARFLGKRIILHWHGYGILDLCRRYPKLAASYFHRNVKNVVLTQDLRQKLAGCGLDISNTDVLGNFSELPKKVTSAEPHTSKSLRKKLSVLFLGGLMAEKGVQYFMDVASRNNSFHFVLCGSGNAEMMQNAKHLQQTGQLEFRGVVDGVQKQQLMQQTDIFVLQTHYPTEGVPLTILEAMASGCAIVTTRHNGIPETVGDAAYFIEAQSADALEQALIALDNNVELLADLKQKALERSGLFSRSAFSAALLGLFKD